MMKSTLIKDLYGEIERLKAGMELYFCMVGGKNILELRIVIYEVNRLFLD